jgi:uncharacterized NAD(P)/FAD-binding protein YdhS
MPPPAHVAIVGCGFTGTSAFFQLVDRFPVREITLFEATGEFGPGYPYRPSESRDYLINNTTGTMCLQPGNRRAFLDWLRGRPDIVAAPDPAGHLPRALFGRFLQDVVAATRTAAAVKGIATRLVPAEVTDIAEHADGRVTLSWAGGSVTADLAILATGRCPPGAPPPAPLPGMTARLYPTHIPGRLLDDVPLDAECHLLGASLSAYDVVNKLFAPESGCRFERDAAGALRFVPGPNRRRVVLCSRSGRLKKVESRRRGPLERRHLTLPALARLAGAGGGAIADIAALVRREAEAHGAAVDWAAVADPYEGCADAGAVAARAGDLLARDLAAALTPGANFLVDLAGDAAVTIWDGFAAGALAPAEERRYRRRLETAMLTYTAPCPVPTAERLLALLRAGRLAVLRGVAEVTPDPAADRYRIAHQDGVALARIVIDTSGALDRRVDSPGQPPLIAALGRRGLLRPHARDGLAAEGAAVDMASFRAAGARSIHVASMLLWGPGFFTSSAFMMATVVERLLAAAFAERAG